MIWCEAQTMHRHVTATPGTFVAELVARLGTEPERLSIHIPTLQDAYLTLIEGVTA